MLRYSVLSIVISVSDYFPERIQKALELAGKAVDLEPENPDVLDTLGWVYFKEGDLHRAVELFQQALKLNPDSPDILFHLGNSLIQTGDENKGKAFLGRLLEKYTNHPLSETAKNILSKCNE